MCMKDVTIRWNDTNDIEQGYRIYRSNTPMDTGNMPTPIATVESNVTEYIDANQPVGYTNYYRVSAFIDGHEEISEELEYFVEILNGPGPQELIGGDMTAGFFGEVPTTELFNGDQLAATLDLTDGVSQFSDEPWLKFAIDDKIIYVSKKPYRHSLSWNELNSKGLVYGDSEISNIQFNQYEMNVRLLKCASSDPFTDNTGVGSEWNRLIYKVHVDDPDGTPWANYTNSDLNIASGAGRYKWGQEKNANNSSEAVTRGNFSSLVHFGSYPASAANNSIYGWHPVLEIK